jgi:hypothetical protein
LVIEANRYDYLTFSENDCQNYIDKVRRLRLLRGDADAIQNHFVRMQKQNCKFYYVTRNQVTKILDPNVTQVKDILLQKGSLSKLVKL